MDLVVPSFKPGIALPDFYQKSQPSHADSDFLTTEVSGKSDRADTPVVNIPSSSPIQIPSSLAPMKSLSQETTTAEGDALSSIADASSFEDMERTIAKAQQTKVHCFHLFDLFILR